MCVALDVGLIAGGSSQCTGEGHSPITGANPSYCHYPLDGNVHCNHILKKRSLTFRRLFVLVVLDHERRHILRVGVTAHPTAVWLAAQVRCAFACPRSRPRFLLRDCDGAYGRVFDQAVAELGIRTLRTTPQSPCRNAYVERVIGSIRRECLDHVIVLSQAGLQALLAEYVRYYNAGRAHQGLGGERPEPRPRRANGRVVARPVLGGLHHVYDRAA